MRTKNVAFVALGFVTLLNETDWLPLGDVAFEALRIRNEPAVAVLAVQPVLEPKPVGCDASVELLFEKPAGVVQDPLAVVQAVNDADLIIVVEGTVNVNVYDVFALATELPNVSVRPVTCAAEAIDEHDAIITTLMKKR